MSILQQLRGSVAHRRGTRGCCAPLPARLRKRRGVAARALPASELADAISMQQLHVQVLMDLAAAAAAAPGDAAAAASSGADTSVFAPLTNTLETVLKQIQGVLTQLHVPYSYGYSIILLTVLVKVLTYPLTKQQVGYAGAWVCSYPAVPIA